MNSDGFSSDRCSRIVKNIYDLLDSGKEDFGKSIAISSYDINQLEFSCETEWDTENSDKFSKPMVWIGIYIAIASFFCILAMAADLLHGFQNKKFWFPCKFFSLNAASITVITVTLKLPVDLSSQMPTEIDQATKLGSLAFMCIMMANLMPSLASMDNETLPANVIGLSILVITVIVNIIIQINTGVINNNPSGFTNDYFYYILIAYIYMFMMLLLLIIAISSSLAIPTSKEVLDSRYQAIHNMSLTNQRLQHIQTSAVEKLRQHVRRYWVMADTGSPQFVMASNPLSTASGIVCVLVLLINFYLLVFQSRAEDHWTRISYKSQYKWSTVAIYIIQLIGVLVGAIAPICRCFPVFRFKLVIKWNKNRMMFFKVEKYWTQKLHEWKQSPIPFLSSRHRSRGLIYNSTNIILSLCIWFQKVIVISCKLIWLMMVSPILGVSYFNDWKSLKVASATENAVEDLRIYVLRIDNEIFELGEKTLNDISNSMNTFILKAAKKQNNNLLRLLEKSTGFNGVEIFDSDHVQPLLPVELVNNWSLPIVTITCIAVSLLNKDLVKSFETLFVSVDEGLSYVHLVEESLNCESEHVNLQKTSKTLWHEIEHRRKWLDNPISNSVFKGKKATKIIRWFSDQAKETVIRINESTNREPMENPFKMLIAANSMYRITQTLLVRYQSNIKPITKKQVLAHLNDMIADIFCACFTNIPRVITMRCHESVIEKREASVKVAAKLLGKTTKIIERLEKLELPSMDDDKMAYIDEWRLYLKHSVP